MNKLLALADRVEKLTGPDDDVFREAFDACYPKPERVWEDEGRECWSTEYENHYNLSWQFESFLEVGAYLDAAMMLVPVDYHAKVSGVNQSWNAEVNATSYGSERVMAGAIGWSGPTALIIAVLRARAHGGGEG